MSATSSPASTPRVLKVDPRDNVVVALADIKAGGEVGVGGVSVTAAERIPAKHKLAERAFSPGDEVVMYGVVVGEVVEPIPVGGLISTRNLRHKSGGFSGKTRDLDWTPPDVSRWQSVTFDGYHRRDGRVGTANHWIVLPLVFCENRNLKAMREALEESLGYARISTYRRFGHRLAELHRKGASDEELQSLTVETAAEETPGRVFPNIDGVKFLEHAGGCGCNYQEAEALGRLLAGYIAHPNVAGATVLSLGCQHTQIEMLNRQLAELSPGFDKPLLVFEQQKSASERKMLEDAIRATFQGLAEANSLRRAPAPLSKLTLGLECGGSDGFSGLSANPLLGKVSDMLCALGGSPVLAEFPELCGVEQELCDRCVDQETADRFVRLMRGYAAAAERVDSGFDMNPSPGNIRDGLVTDAMKSAGAARKGGTAPVTDVLDYTQPVHKPGLNLLCTPGNDVESTTALVGSGCNLILFTTGLGTPAGNPVTPVMKVSSNSALARRMPDIIDFDAGSVIGGAATLDDLAEQLMARIVDVASGRATPKAVELGQNDFIPWRRGVSL